MTKLFAKRFKRLALKKEKKASKEPVDKPPSAQHDFNSNSNSNSNNNSNNNNKHNIKNNSKQNKTYTNPFEMPIDVDVDDIPIVNFNSSTFPLHQTQEHEYSIDEANSNDISIMDTSNSIETSTSSNNSNRTMSFGSSNEQDSFAVVSHTGLSDDDISINSRYLDEPRRKEGNTCDNHGSNSRTSTGTTGTHTTTSIRTSTSTSTSTLPRLTIQTKQTKALLATTTHEHNKGQYLISPNTVVIQPETPTGTVNSSNEFPVTTQTLLNNTPEINMNIPDSPSHSQSFSMSLSHQERPSFDTSFLKERQLSKESKSLQAAYKELEYWDEELKQTMDISGHTSIQSAQGMMNLGASLLRCRKYPEALTVYKNAVAIWRIRRGEHSLIVAKGLDKIGLSASLCSSKDNLDWAYLALKEALQIRMVYLGPHHCDCVDTLNNIAGVFLQRKELAIARDIYLDVLNVRASIFGNYHASIAITAQTLGKISFQLRDFDNALLHYALSLRIYKSGEMNLKQDHPLVMKVMKYVELTHRMMNDCC